MIRVTLLLKRLLMWSAFGAVSMWAVMTRRTLEEPERVGILFLTPLGMGDLVMLSPVIQEIERRFSKSTIYLVSNHPDFIRFERITVIDPDTVRNESLGFDLVISPTLALRHLRYIATARNWIGYFSRPVLQSNCIPCQGVRYDPRHEHYIWRGIRLLQSLAPAHGNRLAEVARQHRILYPPFSMVRPRVLEREQHSKRYMVLSVLSKWGDRQWSMDWTVEVARRALSGDAVDSVVLVGDNSKEEIGRAAELEAQLSEVDCVNVVGELTLPELSYLIAGCELFLGLDSGPAHIAALLARRAIVIYVTVPPALRRPLTTSEEREFHGLYPDPPPPKPLYDGFAPVPVKMARKYARNISISRVMEAVDL